MLGCVSFKKRVQGSRSRVLQRRLADIATTPPFFAFDYRLTVKENKDTWLSVSRTIVICAPKQIRRTFYSMFMCMCVCVP